MWLVPTTTSPTPSAGSRPPATPHSISARQSKRSSSRDVATPALTLPAPDSTNTASRPAICAAPEGQAADFVRLARLVGEMGELLGQGRYDAQKPVCHGRMGYKVAASRNVHVPSPTSHDPARRLHRPRPRRRARDHAHLCRRPRRAHQGRQEPGHRRRPRRRGDHRRRPARAHARPAGRRRGGDGGGPRADARRPARSGWSIRSTAPRNSSRGTASSR